MRISDWSSDVCSSDLLEALDRQRALAEDQVNAGVDQGAGGLALVFRDCRRVLKYAPVAAHDADVGPLLKRRQAFAQGNEIVAVHESAHVGFAAPVLPGCILGQGMPTQWPDARGPAASTCPGKKP